MVEAPEEVAEELGEHLGVPARALSAPFGQVRGESIGRHRNDLTPEQLDDVLAEAGDLLRQLGYT